MDKKTKHKILRHVTPLLILYPISIYIVIIIILNTYTMSLGDDMLYIAIYIIAATLLLIVEKGYILINKTDYRKIWKDEITIISTVSILIALIMAIYK